MAERFEVPGQFQGLRRIRTSLLATVAGLLAVTASALASVEFVPGASLEVDGRDIEGHVAIAGYPILKVILGAFDRAEEAVQKKDLESLMQFYAQAYNYHGLKKKDVRRVWSEVFEHYRQLSSTHLFTDAKITTAGGQTKAELTCTGGLYGIEVATGRRITLDSWFREVHYLVKENGAWHFLGNAGDAPTSAPVGSAPHHPLF